MKPPGDFSVGDRVRLTTEGRALHRQSPDRVGSVIGASRDGVLVKVQWDELRTPGNYHPDFVQRAPRPYRKRGSAEGA